MLDSSAPTVEEFEAILQQELSKMNSHSRRAYINDRLLDPYQITLKWEYGNDEPFVAWVFADLRRNDVMAVYCRGGFGALGSPWGMNFRTADHFGQDSGWFPTLDALLKDEGVES